MKLIIDIPEHCFEELKCVELNESNEGVVFHAIKCILNGAPLPKGHGRLKDIDAFISKVQADRQHAVYTRSWTADDVLNALTNSYAPTIIEADKENT